MRHDWHTGMGGECETIGRQAWVVNVGHNWQAGMGGECETQLADKHGW